MDVFNLSHFSACMYPCIIARQGFKLLAKPGKTGLLEIISQSVELGPGATFSFKC